MQKIEFNATVENGTIIIPESYKSKIPNRVKVMLVEETFTSQKKINFDELTLETRGFKYNREEANDW